MVSLKKKENYLDGFFKKRYGTILVPYIMVAGLYWLWSVINGNAYSISFMISSYLSGYPFVENTWYVIVILLYYVVFYLLARIDTTSHYIWITCGTILFGCVWTIFCLWRQWGDWWFVSSFAIAAGVIWGIYEKHIIEFVKKHYVTLLVAGILLWGILWTWYIAKSDRVVCVLASTMFPLVLLMILLKLEIGNRIWTFLGRISYEIYLTHGFFVKILRGDDVYIESDFLYIIAIFALTFLTSYVIHLLKAFLLHKVVRI